MTRTTVTARTGSGRLRRLRAVAWGMALVMAFGACAGSAEPDQEAGSDGLSLDAGDEAGTSPADQPVSDPASGSDSEPGTDTATESTDSSTGSGAASTSERSGADRRSGAANQASSASEAPARSAAPGAPGGQPESSASEAPGPADTPTPSESDSPEATPAPDPNLPAPTAPRGSGPGSVPAAQDGVIKIGMIYPLSGPLGPNGRSMLEGFQAVLSQVNDQGGIDGAEFKFLVRDDQFDPAQSKRYVRELLSEDIWAFSGFTPALWLAAKDELIESGVLGFPFDVGAERQRQVRTSFAPYQNCLRAQAGTIMQAMEQGHKRFAFLELDIEAVHHCIDYSADLVEKLGGEVVYRGNVAPGAPDCGPQVLAARGATPDTVLPFIEVLGTIKCVQAIRQQGWDVPVQVGMNVAGDTAFIDALGQEAEGVTSVSPWLGMPTYPAWEDTCGIARKYFPDHVASWYSSAGCAPAIVLKRALQALGSTATRDQVVEYLETHTIDTGGLTPPVTYRPGDHRPFDSVIPVVVQDGRWVQTGEAFVPERLSNDITDGE